MDKSFAIPSLPVALLLLGSAIFLSSCKQENTSDILIESPENTPTQVSNDLTVKKSENGRTLYIFTTPLLENYDLAKEPYTEFKKGVKVVTYNDSTQTVESQLTANYAIYYTNKKLWEAKGDVVARNVKGETLYTQQLFWDMVQKRVYSNVDSKVVQGDNVMVGSRFESDEAFEHWKFMHTTGKILVDTTRNAGSGPGAPSATDTVAAAPSSPSVPSPQP